MIMSREKKKILVFIMLMILISIPITHAFLADEDSVTNKFSVGENISHIEEAFGSYSNFKAGKSYKKNVTVKNDGSVDCYVRVFAEIEDPEVAEKLTVNYNTNKWTAKQADGYYYYKDKIKPGEKTVPLFTKITAKKDTDEFQMICYSETVQSDGSSDPLAAFTDNK